jgi:hypothetical protein
MKQLRTVRHAEITLVVQCSTCCALAHSIQYIGMLMRTVQIHAVLYVHSSVVIQVLTTYTELALCAYYCEC